MSAAEDFARFQRIEKLIVERLRSENVPVFKMDGEWFLQAVVDDDDFFEDDEEEQPTRHLVAISGLARFIAEDGR